MTGVIIAAWIIGLIITVYVIRAGIEPLRREVARLAMAVETISDETYISNEMDAHDEAE